MCANKHNPRFPMRSILFLFLLLSGLGTVLHAQIESGKSGPKKKKPREVKTTVPTDDYSLFSLNFAYGSSYRSLKPNGDFYGEELGEKSRETRLPVSGVYLAANTRFEGHFHLDFALGFQQYGEQYAGPESDTIVSYTNTYSQLVLPLKVHYQTGQKLVFFVGTGLQAQLMAAYVNKTTTETGDEKNTVKTTELKNKSPFSIASTSAIGIQYPLGNKTTLILSGDYIQQLTNTFNTQAAYIHRSSFWGVKLGLGFKI